METRASYIAVGSFVLILILGLVGFVIWVGKFRGAEEFARYDILFAGSVTGLQVDGTVRYRGIPVGRILDIQIDRGNTEQVRVTIEVKADTPVRMDTVASIELQGITGVTYVLLKGFKQDSPALPVTMKEPYPEIKSIPSKLEKLFESAPDLLSKTSVLVDRVTLLFSDENEQNISETLANLRALSDRFANGGGNLDAMLESGKSALAKIDSMSTELEGLAKDLRSQLTTPGTEGRTTVADILSNANTAIQQLQKTGGEFEQLAHDVRGQLSTPGAAGSPTIADVLREGTTTLQRIQTVGTDFEGLVADLRKQMAPGAEGHATVADVLDRGAVTIDQLNKTASEFEQFAHDLRIQLTTPNSAGSATVADLVQQGKATLERIQGMSSGVRNAGARPAHGPGGGRAGPVEGRRSRRQCLHRGGQHRPHEHGDRGPGEGPARRVLEHGRQAWREDLRPADPGDPGGRTDHLHEQGIRGARQGSAHGCRAARRQGQHRVHEHADRHGAIRQYLQVVRRRGRPARGDGQGKPRAAARFQQHGTQRAHAVSQ